MPSLQETLVSKRIEAEQLVTQIRTLPRESEEGIYAIHRWAVVNDELKRLMIQAEEALSPAQLARAKAEVNGEGPQDLWAKYRESEWILPKLGAPGPGDEPPPMVPIWNFLR